MRRIPRLSPLWLLAGLCAQEPAEGGDAFGSFRDWLKDYKAGAVRFMKEGRTDDEAIAAADRRMAAIAALDTLAAAQELFQAAVVDPQPSGAGSSVEALDFQREVQPWRVQQLAAKHLRTMKAEGLVPWLIGMLYAKGLRAATLNDDQRNARAVLRILGGHPSTEARLELLRAASAMPDELRVQAVNSMSADADIAMLPTLLDLLRDKEPNIRIAAANSIGAVLQPHVDESLDKSPDGELLKQRDQAIDKLGAVLLRDKVWQVRSAAAFSLAQMRCKAVIPVLIDGLDAELKRKKDPWAMDMRLHRLLEGLTGQSVVLGTIAPWRQFWTKEGASFAVRPKPAGDEAPKSADRYRKFFDLQIESDRVLFVLDFSGSMAEPANLKPEGTVAAAPGTSGMTKAQLVVRELKQLVMSLPDGALLNFVVFSDDVRIWRKEGNHAALVKLDDDTRDELLGNFLDGLRPAGPTNLYDALAAALDFGGRGLYDKHYDAGFDTLYVISDGAPTAGPITDKDEIRRRVREANQLRKIAIHCVTFGDQNDTAFLKPLAEENGGRHIHVE